MSSIQQNQLKFYNEALEIFVNQMLLYIPGKDVLSFLSRQTTFTLDMDVIQAEIHFETLKLQLAHDSFTLAIIGS